MLNVFNVLRSKIGIPVKVRDPLKSIPLLRRIRGASWMR